MTLPESLVNKLEIERFIFDQGGELTVETEAAYENAVAEVQNRTDRAVMAYKEQVNQLEYAKSALNELVTAKKQQIERYRNFLHRVVKEHGDLKTPIASISHRQRMTERVIIWDFSKVEKNYPEAVTHHFEDNKRITSLSKTKLKEIWKNNPNVLGYEVVEHHSEWPDIRIRSRNGATQIENQA